MMKTEVYSWRLSPDLKAALEEAAHEERVSMAEILERVVQEWLSERASTARDTDEGQERLRASALRFVGVLRGGDPHRAETIRQRVRERLVRRHDR